MIKQHGVTQASSLSLFYSISLFKLHVCDKEIHSVHYHGCYSEVGYGHWMPWRIIKDATDGSLLEIFTNACLN